MELFWQITGKIANCTIRNNEADRTRIWGTKGHHMELYSGLF